MKTLNYNWEFGVLGIYNYHSSGKFNGYFDFMIENHDVVDGDICEVGVYRGSSILATALLLKEIGSNKLVWGFDSFEGFPTYHANDKLEKFDELYSNKSITRETYEQVKLNQKYQNLLLRNKLIKTENISTSGDFSDTSLEVLEQKIAYLGLDNIRLIKGSFQDTMLDQEQNYPNFAACLLDCDLYNSYKLALPFVWQRLSPGGYIFLDEYFSLKFPGARIAIDEFFADQQDKPQQHKQVKGEFPRWFVRKIFT